jgi:hypothetical protein
MLILHVKFCFYFRDQYVIRFHIQVDVLKLKFVFQDHYFDFEETEKIYQNEKCMERNRDFILQFLRFCVWYRMPWHHNELLIQRFRFRIVLNVIHTHEHHDQYEKI